MKVNSSLFDVVLKAIEEGLHFKGEDMTSAQDWDILLDIKVDDIISKSPDESEEIKYIIKSLELLDHIIFKSQDKTTIESVTTKGISLIYSRLYDITI